MPPDNFARKVDAARPLDRCLEQIHEHEDAVHAWVLVDEVGARQTATERTREAALAQWRGPLHGIPVGIKDIIDVQGFATGAGSPLCGHQSASADAPLVAALRRAGAVILGKTVTVEFACFDPSPTRNPWNLAHTPGGSSSGSAAAVAMGMCLGGLGHADRWLARSAVGVLQRGDLQADVRQAEHRGHRTGEREPGP